jgi:hypothetical protein
MLQRVVTLDPAFACAHVTLGRFHLNTAQMGMAADRGVVSAPMVEVR